jgi:hypothetical protein
MSTHTVIVLTEDAAIPIREFLKADGYDIIVPPSPQSAFEVIASSEPLALIVGDSLKLLGQHSLLESIWSRAPRLPIIHWDNGSGGDETAASFSLRSPEHLRMALSDMAAII